MSAATDSESQSSDRARSSSPLRSDDPRSPKDLQHNEAVQNDEDVDIDVTSIPSEIASDDDELEDEEDRTADEDEYFKPIKKLCMRQGVAVPVIPAKPNASTSDSNKPLSSFFIRDILNHKPAIVQRAWSPCVAAPTAASAVGAAGSTEIRGIVRPWDLDSSTASRRRPRSADDDSRSERSESDSPESPQVANANASPLDALFEMTSKAFEGLEANEKSADSSRDHLNMFNNRQQPKKKRKSRTAFTNHQIFELEKRFLYQKYLSPADRDEIAQSLGLTNAQVITWFQNRRAKLKRDMEELKKDVEHTNTGVHRNIIENIQDLSLLKKNKDGKIICSMLP